MELSGNELVLVLRCPDKGPKKVEFVSSVASALPSWNGRDRISPLFEVSNQSGHGAFVLSKRRGHLLFFGPVAPKIIDPSLSLLDTQADRAWLTFGLFNFVVYVTSRSRRNRLLKWANTQDVRWEAWRLNGANLVDVQRCRDRHVDLGTQLAKLVDFKPGRSPLPELRDAGEEYCILMAAAACRSSHVDVNLVRELSQANEIIIKAATDTSIQRKSNGLAAIALLVDANAALSRFTSQTFSGFSPIQETECHFWTHSLLGTGVANLALVNIRRFITQTLGEARIPEQVHAFRSVTDAALLKNVIEEGTVWNEPWLQELPKATKVPVLDGPLSPLCPLVTYLSGRDGFHTTQVSLSAPLSVLTSCNSLRWSLSTITHEMAHRVVDEALSYILPDPSEEKEVLEAASLLNQERTPANLLECLEFKILESMAKLNAAVPLIDPQDKVNPAHILDLIGTRREEVEEIMVHVFDFIYFYGSDPESYVPAIWRSWDAIPSLHRRLPAYVLRTLCAVNSKYWSSKTSTQDTITAVTAGMELVAKSDKDNAYIHDALDHLRTYKETLQKQLRRRRWLIGTVRTFLQSPLILQAVRGQAYKPHRTLDLVLDGASIENPLRFIESNTSVESASTLKSFVMLARLAFDTIEPSSLRIEGIHR